MFKTSTILLCMFVMVWINTHQVNGGACRTSADGTPCDTCLVGEQFVKLQEERSVRVDFVNEDPGIYVTLVEVRQLEPLATKNAMMWDARKTKVQNAKMENVLEVHSKTEMAD